MVYISFSHHNVGGERNITVEKAQSALKHKKKFKGSDADHWTTDLRELYFLNSTKVYISDTELILLFKKYFY